MSLRQDFQNMSRAARPKILSLAREHQLVDACFGEFCDKVYPGAPEDQVRELRTAFFAGAAELLAMMTYGSDEGLAVTGDDMVLMANINTEIEKFYAEIVAKATPTRGTA